ncbi:hypothetical protein SDC9_81476 [bioreactor metagenome]|uniref:Uncharacterized protein n=1 Tax=bioreactor metagenome TaxID=1076179 RepID=A0A644Z221_9ZZZZ
MQTEFPIPTVFPQVLHKLQTFFILNLNSTNSVGQGFHTVADFSCIPLDTFKRLRRLFEDLKQTDSIQKTLVVNSKINLRKALFYDVLTLVGKADFPKGILC